MALFQSKPKLFGVGTVLPVHDIPATVDHYCRVLGFDRDFVMGDPPSHGSVTRCSVGIQFTSAPSAFDGSAFPGWYYFFVDHVDSLFAEYQRSEAKTTRELADQSHGMREFEIVDCNGFRLRFGQYL